MLRRQLREILLRGEIKRPLWSQVLRLMFLFSSALEMLFGSTLKQELMLKELRKPRFSKRVFVGLSGGVDSSVAAYLLKKQGYDVVGVHLRCWNKDGCNVADAEDARRVAEVLNIPFYVLNLEEDYKRAVVDYMVKGYADGFTPNPDVMCNKEIKFGLFLKKALELGADYIATGNYVKVQKSHAYRQA